MASLTPQRQEETAVLGADQKINLKKHDICKAIFFRGVSNKQANKGSFKTQKLVLKEIKSQNSGLSVCSSDHLHKQHT